MKLPAALKSFAAYGVAVILMKGFSLVTIPLVASHLAPADYGELDLAVSLVEFTALFCGWGLAEMLYRFCSIPAEAGRGELRALAGTALAVALAMATLVQIAAPSLHEAAGLGISLDVFRLALAAASTTALVELPLAHLRLRDRALRYLVFVLARTLSQIALIWLLLSADFGPAGVLLANALVHFAFAAALLIPFLRESGIGLSRAMAHRLFAYGLPLVLAALSMFALGTADRWFLAGAVSRDELAHYAIAAKLGLAASLVIQPLGMWWYPRRLAILREPGGISRNARIWSAGLAILVSGAAMLNAVLPFFVETALPAAYSEALPLLPWLTAIIALNELVSLSNAGAYLGRNSWSVFSVNAIAALIVIALYWLSIPHFGLMGAIGATLAAQGFRLFAFAFLSRTLAPVPLFSPRTGAILLAAVLPSMLMPADADPAVILALAAVTPLLVLAALLAGRIQALTGILPKLRHA